MVAAVALFCALFCTGAQADGTDRTRGILYRIDAEASSVRLHPEQAWGPVASIARQAGDAAAQLDQQGMKEAAASLREEAAALQEAARRDEAEDVRAHAIVIESLVRHIDEKLPSRDIAR
jgi:hypothetical protein